MMLCFQSMLTLNRMFIVSDVIKMRTRIDTELSSGVRRTQEDARNFHRF